MPASAWPKPWTAKAWVLSFRDITARMQAEQALLLEKEEQKTLIRKLEEAHNQLLQSEKMASIGQFALSGNHIQMIIGEFAPLLFDITLQLFPIAFDTIPVHCCLLIRVDFRDWPLCAVWQFPASMVLNVSWEPCRVCALAYKQKTLPQQGLYEPGQLLRQCLSGHGHGRDHYRGGRYYGPHDNHQSSLRSSRRSRCCSW